MQDSHHRAGISKVSNATAQVGTPPRQALVSQMAQEIDSSVERFTLPEALQDTNEKLSDNVHNIVRPLTDPTVRHPCVCTHVGHAAAALSRAMSSCSQTLRFLHPNE